MSEPLKITHEYVEEQSLGRCWFALLDNQVVGIIAMTTPRHSNISFDEYRTRALHCLTLLGETKAGDLVAIDGKKYCAKNLTHKNRGKGPRTRTLYPIAPWVLSGLGSSVNKVKSSSVIS